MRESNESGAKHLRYESTDYFYYHRMSSLLEEAEKTEKLLREQLKFNDRLYHLVKYEAETIKELLEYALEDLLTLLNGNMGFLALVDEEAKKSDILDCVTRSIRGPRAKNDNGPMRLQKSGILKQMIQNKEPALVADCSDRNTAVGWLTKHSPGTRHFLLSPVVKEGKLVVLAGIGRRENDFDYPDVQSTNLYLSNLWDKVEKKRSEIVQNKRKVEILYHSYHDPLTGMYNRRFFEEELHRLNTSRNLPISLIYADVNGLKIVNDTLGHEKGDSLIKAAADVIRSCCREDDLAARTGGDEFVILLPKTKSSEAMQIINRIQDLCDRKSAALGPLSISLGCGTREVMETSIQDVMRQAENQMYERKTLDASEYRSKSLDAITSSLYNLDESYREHANRVSHLSVALGSAMGLSKNDLDELEVAGRFHDIGFFAVIHNLSNKEVATSKKDWAEIRRHAEVGYRLLNSMMENSRIAEIILAHHERWDGNGYPKGIRGEEIPLLSRIISIAEAFDAMTSNRYRECSKTRVEALQELRRESGTQFDPGLVTLFCNLDEIKWKQENENA